MSVNGSRSESPSPAGPVTITDWLVCINNNDGILAVSCTVNTVDSSEGITGVGLILNTSGGKTVASAYVGMSGGSKTATPGINMPAAGFAEGESVSVVAQGECNGKHFFAEKDVIIGECQAP